ncbi:MAG: FeoB-associated Cys-rich membrane protein [Oscillospiraceae bacterium]|nr:FeoB-associated Cys-rich membrane protein [Oscillospiraceae bacterium]
MENVIVIIILIAIVGGIVFYLYRAKKSGQKCIGCPYAKECAKRKKSCGGCDTKKEK